MRARPTEMLELCQMLRRQSLFIGGLAAFVGIAFATLPSNEMKFSPFLWFIPLGWLASLCVMTETSRYLLWHGRHAGLFVLKLFVGLTFRGYFGRRRGRLLLELANSPAVQAFLQSHSSIEQSHAVTPPRLEPAPQHRPNDRDLSVTMPGPNAERRRQTQVATNTDDVEWVEELVPIAEVDSNADYELIGDDDEDLPFRKLAHYEIRRRVGRGGMGEVYLGYEPALQRQVAVKVLPDELMAQERVRQRFQAEATAVAKLQHPNILPIYFFGEDAGHHFFVMQFVEGESLDQRMRRKKVSVKDAVRIVQEALGGLAFAHEKGIIHRDIKPGNILLDNRQKRVFLADFGLAKSLQPSPTMTATGVVVGTPAYFAPEQLLNAPLDGRTDLYAMGLVLYELLAHRRAFESENFEVAILQRLHHPPTWLSDVAPHVPATLCEIVMRMLERNPVDRYQSADEVLEELEAWQTGTIATPRRNRDQKRRGAVRVREASAVRSVAKTIGWVAFSAVALLVLLIVVPIGYRIVQLQMRRPTSSTTSHTTLTPDVHRPPAAAAVPPAAVTVPPAAATRGNVVPAEAADDPNIPRDDALLSDPRIKALMAKPLPGADVTAESKLWKGMVLVVSRPGNRWRPITVLDLLPRGDVRIHYIDWSTAWDEVVPRSKLQFPVDDTINSVNQAD